jgi:hypothetical protein
VISNAPFLAGRALALYGLSLVAAASAYVAWSGTRLLPLIAIALVLAVAASLGEAVGAELLAARSPEVARARLWAFVLLMGIWPLGLAVAAGRARVPLLQKEALFFTLLQALLLLVPVIGPRQVAPLANALVLTLLASLRGGLPAIVATVAFCVGTALLVLFDHYAARLSSVRSIEPALVRLALSQARDVIAPIAAGLVLYFALVPAAPHAAFLESGVETLASEQELARAYAHLSLVALFGTVMVYYATRLLRRRSAGRSPTEEDVVLERGAEEAIPERPRRSAGRYEGKRGAIVRAYLRVLERAAALGFERLPSDTASELASRLRAPKQPLSRLTSVFMDARYGSAEPSLEDARAAEADAKAVLAGLEPARPGTLRDVAPKGFA